MNYMKTFFCCLLLSIAPFSQDDTEGIVEENDPAVKQAPEEKASTVEVSAPQEVEKIDHAGKSVEIPESSPSNSQVKEASDNEETAQQKEPGAQGRESPSEKESDKSDQDAVQGGATSVDQLREEARLLQEQAEKLYNRAEEFGDHAENVDKAIEDLEDLADELEEEAEELLGQAGELQMCIKMADEAQPPMPVDSSIAVSDTDDTVLSEGDMQDHKVLMLKMRNSANQLLMKAKEIAVQVREMKETGDEREDLSDEFDDQASALEDKSEELEEAADSLEEAQNMLPLAIRFPFRLGHQLRISAVPPYDDKKAHILLISGFHFSFYFKNFLSIGIEDLSIRFNETIHGTRIAICGSPIVSYSFFPLKKLELGVGIGGAIQGQVGADKSYDIAGAPFIKLFNETWVARRFSLGPVLKINFGAQGNFFTRVLPSDNAKVLPEKAWWMDFGVTYTFHL